jgi:hypothetical protein
MSLHSLLTAVPFFIHNAMQTVIVFVCGSFFYSIDGVMVSVLTSSVADRGFETRPCQTKDYKIGICCFSAKHAALRKKKKDWSARNQDNDLVSFW